MYDRLESSDRSVTGSPRCSIVVAHFPRSGSTCASFKHLVASSLILLLCLLRASCVCQVILKETFMISDTKLQYSCNRRDQWAGAYIEQQNLQDDKANSQ